MPCIWWSYQWSTFKCNANWMIILRWLILNILKTRFGQFGFMGIYFQFEHGIRLNRIIDFLHFGNLDIGLVELYGKHFGQTTFIQEKTFGMANLVWRCFMQISFWIWRVLWNSIQQSDISRISRGTGLSLSYWICPMIVFIEKSNHSLKEIAPGGKMLKRMCYCYSFQFWRNINWCLIINHRRRWWMFLWIVPSPFSSIAANMFLRSSSPSAGRLSPSLQ